MNTGVKGILLVVGAYAVTLVVCACTTLTTTAFTDTTNCGAVSRALGVMFVTMGALFLASVAIVGIVARKMVGHVAGCLAIVILYAVVMVASYVVVAFGLMVAFNC
jgi:hypothetical protein